MYINPNVTPAIAARQRMERSIVRRVVKDALAAGYVLDVDDGGDELAVKGATTVKAAIDALMNTDDDKLILRRGKDRGWVRFVYGNDGWDVINDYSINIEGVLVESLDLTDRMEERANR